MGLITSVNNLSYTLEEEKKNRQLERIKKQNERQKKEDLKRYKNELEMFLKKEFERYFEAAGSCYIVEFYDRKRKQEILQNYFETIKTIDNKGIEKIPYKPELEQYYYNKYNTILSKAHKEQKQQEEYNLQQLPIEAESKKANIDWEHVIPKIFKIILIIAFLPIIFILSIIFGCFKDME